MRKVTPGTYLLHLPTHQHTYTHMLGPHACFGWVPLPQSPVYIETLARDPHTVYPPRFLWMAVSRGANVLLWLWLGHRNMESKGLPILTTRFPPVEPMWEFPPLSQEPNHRYTWKVTSGTYLLHVPTHQYTYTHMLGQHTCFGWIPLPRSSGGARIFILGIQSNFFTTPI
jgi:hypothetical protein